MIAVGGVGEYWMTAGVELAGGLVSEYAAISRERAGDGS
jgi:hypothetical protein